MWLCLRRTATGSSTGVPASRVAVLSPSPAIRLSTLAEKDVWTF